MRGQILGVDRKSGFGVVAGDDGQRYRFEPADWAHSGGPSVGVRVDFETREDRALTIFPEPGAAAQQALARPGEVRAKDRDKTVAALLAFFIGTLGIHRFYLGRNGSGIVMLILSITVLGLLITAPWSIIDAVRYLVMSDEEFARRYPR